MNEEKISKSRSVISLTFYKICTALRLPPRRHRRRLPHHFACQAGHWPLHGTADCGGRQHQSRGSEPFPLKLQPFAERPPPPPLRQGNCCLLNKCGSKMALLPLVEAWKSASRLTSQQSPQPAAPLRLPGRTLAASWHGRLRRQAASKQRKRTVSAEAPTVRRKTPSAPAAAGELLPPE